MKLAGNAFLFAVNDSIRLGLNSQLASPNPRGYRHTEWQRLAYGQGVAGNWDSNVMQAAVAVAAISGVGVAVGVAVTT